MQSMRYMKNEPPLWLAILTVSIASTFYLYEFFVRVNLSVLTHQLMQAFSMDASVLGALSGSFYITYALMQIPAGYMGDRYGPRKMLFYAIFVCALATLAFSQASTLLPAFVARLLIGLTASFAYIGPLMLTARWFAPKHFAMISGIIQATGSVGAILGEDFFSYLLQSYSWRHTLFAIACIGLTLSVLAWLVIRDNPPNKTAQQTTQNDNIRESLVEVVKKQQTWWIAFVGFVFWCTMAAFAESWGNLYVQNLYHISAHQAAQFIAWIWIGNIIGSPFFGWWSNYIGSRKSPISICLFVGLVSISTILYAPPHAIWMMNGLMMMVGLASGGQCITFGLVNDINPRHVVGTAVGFNNMAVIGSGILIQPLVGIILDLVWDGKYIMGIAFYSVDAFKIALSVLPLVLIFGLIANYCFLEETHAKSHQEN
jgi:sugar phosphate permease